MELPDEPPGRRAPVSEPTLERRRVELKTLRLALRDGDYVTILQVARMLRASNLGEIAEIGRGLEAAASGREGRQVERGLGRLRACLDRLEVLSAAPAGR